MTFDQQIKDLDALIGKYEKIDDLAKLKIFTSDLLKNREDMVSRLKEYQYQYLECFRPTTKAWPFFVTSILAAILFFIILHHDFIHPDHRCFMLVHGFNMESCDLYLEYTIYVCLLLIPFSVYSIIRLLIWPIDIIYYLIKKREVKHKICDWEEQYTYEYMQKSLPNIIRYIDELTLNAQTLCEKHGISTSMQNRENIPKIKKLMLLNKEKNPTIAQVCNWMAKNDKIEPSWDLEKWNRISITYCKAFFYYYRGNPWLEDFKEKKKKRKDKVEAIVFFVPKMILHLFFFPYIFLFKALQSWYRDLPNGSYLSDEGTSHDKSPESAAPSEPIFSEPEKRFVFRDHAGNLCESGGVFYDSKGNYCTWGSPFYDSKGYYREWGSSFYDSKGYLREWGDPFFDGEGYLIDPT